LSKRSNKTTMLSKKNNKTIILSNEQKKQQHRARGVTK
jgi:hypothetical protein